MDAKETPGNPHFDKAQCPPLLGLGGVVIEKGQTKFRYTDPELGWGEEAIAPTTPTEKKTKTSKQEELFHMELATGEFGLGHSTASKKGNRLEPDDPAYVFPKTPLQELKERLVGVKTLDGFSAAIAGFLPREIEGAIASQSPKAQAQSRVWLKQIATPGMQ